MLLVNMYNVSIWFTSVGRHEAYVLPTAMSWLCLLLFLRLSSGPLCSIICLAESKSDKKWRNQVALLETKLCRLCRVTVGAGGGVRSPWDWDKLPICWGPNPDRTTMSVMRLKQADFMFYLFSPETTHKTLCWSLFIVSVLEHVSCCASYSYMLCLSYLQGRKALCLCFCILSASKMPPHKSGLNEWQRMNEWKNNELMEWNPTPYIQCYKNTFLG